MPGDVLWQSFEIQMGFTKLRESIFEQKLCYVIKPIRDKNISAMTKNNASALQEESIWLVDSKAVSEEI